MMRARSKRSGERGQAAVETALTMPLTIFLVLGTLQLFMMLQARIMAEYAAFRAVRAGSVNYGDCEVMNHAAIAALLPTLGNTSDPTKFGDLFDKLKNNTYSGAGFGTEGTALDGPVVWIFRERPLVGSVPAPQDVNFDENWSPMTLEARLVFWYPLRIPFADWVISRMALAHFNLKSYDAANPLMYTVNKAGWPDGATAAINDGQVANKYKTLAGGKQYVFPIQASYSMRMMTPAKKSKFRTQNCF